MNIKWFGQSCFLITTNDHTKLLIDPFNQFPGYHLPTTEVDIVTVSHEHFDHNFTEGVKGNFTLIKEAGHYEVKGISIQGINTFHDDVNGAQRGTNTVFKYTIDGITLAHLGDLGHLFSNEQMHQLGHIDILFIPVGGKYTIDAKSACEVVKQLNPTITIPMHFNTKAIEETGLGLANVDSFLELSGLKVQKEEVLEVTKNNLNEYKGIVQLDYVK